jgi:enediyne biosynthesis protein E4
MSHWATSGAAALIVILAAVCGCSGPAPVTQAPPTGPAWFEDVTDRVGLSFTHDAGPITPAYFMPQIMGSGCAFLDCDGDGRLDIYLIHNGGPRGKKNQLFQQQADGRFRDVSAESGLDVAGYGMGVAVGDVNNDGRPDVLLTEYGRTRLFLNLGEGRFKEITQEAGLDNPLWAVSAAFFDFDRDGWLDLVVVNYLDYDPSVTCSGRGGIREFCAPSRFAGSVARLYRNAGSSGKAVRFEDVSLKSGVGTLRGRGLGVLCADFDGDGWPDIFAANDMMANFLWINQRDGTFKEEAAARGVAFSIDGAVAANMGIAWGDVDGDGLPDLFVTHLMNETHALWQHGPRGQFHDRTVAAGLTSSQRSTGFGAAFVDFDRDGWLDLVFVNGGVFRNPDAVTDGPFWPQYAQGSQLYQNTGAGKFRDLSSANPALCAAPIVGRGLAVGDFDNDGAPDLLITQTGGPARLLRNQAHGGHWLSVAAVLPELHRAAHGAEILVRAGGKSYQRLLQPGYSYASSSEARCHFGLAASDNYDAIVVRWPDGSRESFPGGKADRSLELRKGSGTP